MAVSFFLQAHKYPPHVIMHANKYTRPHLQTEVKLSSLAKMIFPPQYCPLSKILQEELCHNTGMTLYFFWHSVDIVKKSGLKDKRFLSVPAMVLMVHMKLRHGHSNQHLATLFSTYKATISVVMWAVLSYEYAHFNEPMKAWSLPSLNDEMKNMLYQVNFQGPHDEP